MVEADKLSPRQRVVLVAMAAQCLDNPSTRNPALVYFGGRELLAVSLGLPRNSTTLRGLARDIAALIEVGVVERIEGGRNGHAARYRLRLPVVDKPRRTVDKGGV